MKQINIIQAYNNLEGLLDIKYYHSKEQWALYNLRKELRSSVEFYEEQTEKIKNKYLEFADEKGILSGTHYQDYLRETEELNNLEIEPTFEKITLPFVDGITFKTAESLEEFIEFKPE